MNPARRSTETIDQVQTSPQRRPPESPKILLNIVVLLIAILVGCLALEVALRVIFYQSTDFSMEMWKYAVQLKRPVDNPQISFRHAPNRSAFLMGVPVSINSDGLRDRDFSLEKPPGVYRIMMLGDSTTFGWGVREENTAAKFLERKLNENPLPGYKSVEVMNAGVGNY